MTICNRATHVLAAGTIILAAAAPMTLRSATATRIPMVNATGVCDGALPSFEGKLRKRPVAISNEGSTTAFVSCSMEGDNFNVIGNSFVGVTFTNRGTEDATATCTMVTDTVDNRGLFTKSIVVEAFPQGVTPLVFRAEIDNGEVNFASMINFSCALPPAVEINYLFRSTEEDIGA